MKKSQPISRKTFLNRLALGAGGFLAQDLLIDVEAAWSLVVETTGRLEPVHTIPTGEGPVRALAYDGENRLFIAGADGVIEVDAEGGPVRRFQPKGLITGIAVDEGGIHLCHPTRVQSLDREGNAVSVWGEAGKDRGRFGHLTGIARSGGMLYLADAGNRRVTRVAVDGDYVDEIEGFHIPSAYFACGIDAAGRLSVGHTSKHRIERYDANHELTGFWGEYGSRPEQFCGCCNPTHVAVFPDGRTVTTEKGIPRLKVYDEEGVLLAHLSPAELGLSPDAHLMRRLKENPDGALPCHDGWPGMPVAASPEGRVAVALPGTGTVRVYRLVGLNDRKAPVHGDLP